MENRTERTIETLVRARYPLVYVVSFEEERVCGSTARIAQSRGKQFFQWSVTEGLETPDGLRLAEFKDPLKVLDIL